MQGDDSCDSSRIWPGFCATDAQYPLQKEAKRTMQFDEKVRKSLNKIERIWMNFGLDLKK